MGLVMRSLVYLGHSLRMCVLISRSVSSHGFVREESRSVLSYGSVP